MDEKVDLIKERNYTKLTEKEKKERIEHYLAELKKLQATPRSDWHAGFEALLRIEMHRFADLVHINTEEEIGEVSPRTDFVILVEDERVDLEKSIYQIFRKINILEYKNPHDSLNERVLRKVCGYANLYIGASEHEGERPADEVTISIFRAVKNPEMFQEMEEKGSLVKDDIRGIYHVKGYTDLPFQIIITGELEGDEYAAYRALTDKAAETDVERIMLSVKEETDEAVLNHYGVLLNLVVEKNPQFFKIVKGEMNMKDVLMEMVKDRVDEKIQEEVQKEVQETKAIDIRNLMTNLKFTIEQAMDALGIPQNDRDIYVGLVQKKMK